MKIPRDIPVSIFLSVSVSLSISWTTCAELTSILKCVVGFKFSLPDYFARSFRGLKRA